MSSSNVETKLKTVAFGAEIHGVDLSQRFGKSETEARHQAFLAHQVMPILREVQSSESFEAVHRIALKRGLFVAIG